MGTDPRGRRLGAADGRAYAPYALFGGNPRALALAGRARRRSPEDDAAGDVAAVGTPGRRTQEDVLDAFADHVRSFVDVSVVSMQVRSITFRKDLEN